MIFEEALLIIETALVAKTNKSLSDAEKEILKAAWENKTYNDVAESLYLSVGYIKDLASLLWQRISEVFLFKVTKSNFRYLLETQQLRLNNSYIKEETFNGNILIVDDLAENLRFLTEILTKCGYKVRSVTNGKMALRTVANNPPDLILMDIKMPQMDGYQVCESLKANPDLSDIPVIFLSALDEVIDKIKAFQIGGVDYITKPFHAEEVIARIQTQLTIQKQKIQLREAIEKHQQTAEVLAQSRALLANLLNSSLDGIAAMQAVRDPMTGEIKDFYCVVVNPVFAKIFNRKRDELMLKGTLKIILDQLNSNLFELLKQVVETEEQLAQEFCYENNGISQCYYFIIVKFGDGVSITARKSQ